MLHSGTRKGFCKWLAAATAAALALTLLPVPGFCQENTSVLHLLIELHRPKKPTKPQPVCLPCTPPGCPMGVCTGAACPWYCPSSCGSSRPVNFSVRTSTGTAPAGSFTPDCANCPASCLPTGMRCNDKTTRCQDCPNCSRTGCEGRVRVGVCRCSGDCEESCAANQATVRRLDEEMRRMCAEQQRHIRQLEAMLAQMQGEIESLRSEKASSGGMSAIVKQLQCEIQLLRSDVQTLHNLQQQQNMWPGRNNQLVPLLPPHGGPPQGPTPMPYPIQYYNYHTAPMVPLNVMPPMVPETLRTPPMPQVPASKPAAEVPWDFSQPFIF
jgi:hypothetical protein